MDKKKQLTVMMPVEMNEVLEAIANVNDRSVAKTIRRLLREAPTYQKAAGRLGYE